MHTHTTFRSPPRSDDRSARPDLLRRHADSPNAYATLQTFLHHFDTPESFIAYGRTLGGVIAIDDSIAHPDDHHALFTAFLTRFPRATFVSLDFLARSQPGHEIPFISRAFEPEPDVRLFTIHHQDHRRHDIPCGFLTFDPWYAQGGLTAYQLNHTRFYSTHLGGVYLALVAHVRQMLYAEGHTRLSLGACAMY